MKDPRTVAVMAALKIDEAVLAELNDDLQRHGTAWAQYRADGGVVRIDPRDVVASPVAAVPFGSQTSGNVRPSDQQETARKPR